MNNTQVSFAEAIYLATKDLLTSIENLQVIGLGVDYPNGADGTMGDLKQLFYDRVWDTPISEGTTSGLVVGSSLSGQPVIIHHGRVEFALFAADQILTQAANWNFMFGGGYPVPATFRIAIGRQWGNGPQHSAAGVPMFASTPGLTVYVPSTPGLVRELMSNRFERDEGPVVFLESRWLYKIQESTTKAPSKSGKCRKFFDGEDITIATYGDGVILALQLKSVLDGMGIHCRIIDMFQINPLDFGGFKSLAGDTKKLLIVDPYSHGFSVGSELSNFATKNLSSLQSAPLVVAPPAQPVPTAVNETFSYYLNLNSLIDGASELLGIQLHREPISVEDSLFPPQFSLDENWHLEKY